MGFNSISKLEHLLLNQTIFCPVCGKEQMFRLGKKKMKSMRFICQFCNLDFIFNSDELKMQKQDMEKLNRKIDLIVESIQYKLSDMLYNTKLTKPEELKLNELQALQLELLRSKELMSVIMQFKEVITLDTNERKIIAQIAEAKEIGNKKVKNLSKKIKE